jgi:dihydrofolate reductase
MLGTMPRVNVFIACSLDGFIAGPDDDLSWLPHPPEDSNDDYGWGDFIGDIGCILMGRNTYDAVEAMDVAWPHKERDTIVATNRPLIAAPPRVDSAGGTIEELIAMAKRRAAPRHVYIDGGNLIRQALDKELIDELIVTVCPSILGAGSPLFAGAKRRHALRLTAKRELAGGVVQLTYIPNSDPR